MAADARPVATGLRRSVRMACAAPSASPPSREDGQRLLLVPRGERIELFNQLRHRGVPPDRLEDRVAATAGPLERLRDAVRMVSNLNAGLSSRTKPALIGRMRRASFELL